MRAALTGARVAPLLVIFIAVVGVVVRIAWQVMRGFYQAPLTFEEDEIARNILAGRGYVYHFLGTDWVNFGLAGFPLLLAALHFLNGGPDRYLLIGLVQAALSSLVVVAAYFIGRQLLAREAGVLAALLVAFHPGLILYAATAVLSPVYDHAVAAGVFVTSLALLRRRHLASTILFGVASALAALLRPTVAVAAALALGALALRPPRAVLAVAAAGLLAASLATSTRSILTPGSPGPLPFLCMQLWVGNNPATSGGALTRQGVSVFDEMPDDLMTRVIGRPEREQGQAFCDAIFSYLSGDLRHAVAWQATKFFYFWWFSPVAGILYPTGWIDTYRVAYSFEAALALLGVAVVWRRGWRGGVALLLLLMLSIAATQALFYVEGRHRLILEPVIAALASCGVVPLAGWARTNFGRLRAADRSAVRA